MAGVLFCQLRRVPLGVLLLLAWLLSQSPVPANPAGGTVAQGTAAISASGSQLTVNQTSPTAFINWSTFDINAGETTTFNQPSASSVTWNQINDSNPSQILGTLNANGYVILQNQNGFYVGGSAVINAHNLVMTTASTPNLDLSSGGAWSFDLPPPSAKIINYGQINITGGGSAFLIADDIVNNGTISAPNGKIGLYAGQTVLVSTSPNGLGLSAQVMLPEGSVDNEGNLIADGGSIAAQAQTVNQNGVVQANSVQNVNGTIELVASGAVNLGANSAISANGDSTASSASPGGFVVLNAGNNTFADTSGSTISVSGANGGQNGIIEIFGNGVTAGTIQSSYGVPYALLINPYDMTISSGATTIGSNPTLNIGNLSSYAQIDLQALDDITLGSTWTLAGASSAAALSLTADNNITLNGSITAGNNWSVNLTAGTQVSSESDVTSGNDGIYLGGSTIQTLNGNINLSAANEVIVGNVVGGEVIPGGGAVRTMNGGNIAVNTTYGEVNAGDNESGYNFSSSKTAPYAVSSNLGGISTYAGGNVSITAGGDVISYCPSVSDIINAGKNAAVDGGSGAFGSQPGNVTIVAGGNVYGNYVLANGVGNITSLNGNVGDPNSKNSQENIFALNLISGSWIVNAPNGSISLQEVRNPNGVFNSKGSSASVFNYAPDASVTLDAGNAVEIWGYDQPGYNDSVPRNPSFPVPVVLPPILNVSAGEGGFTIDHDITIYQSPDANINITTTDGGDFSGVLQPDGLYPSLYMSDSSSSQWNSINTMKLNNTDVVTTPSELNNPNYGPAIINVSRNLEDINIYTVKETQITVGGDMINAGFAAQNLHPTDVTSVTVAGQIFYTPLYAFETLGGPLQPDIPSTDIPLGNVYSSSPLDEFFYLLVNPADVTAVTTASGTTYETTLTAPSGTTYTALNNYDLYPNLFLNRNLDGTFNYSTEGLGYNVTTHTLSFEGPMSTATENSLESGQFYVVELDAQGYPVLSEDSSGNYHLVLDPVSLANPSVIEALYNSSQSTTTTTAYGLQIGGPGQFNITAGSINLGDSYGIESWGINGPQNTAEGTAAYYNPLTDVTPPGGGASINVTTLDNDTIDPGTGDEIASLDMLSSRIASWYGGDVTVVSGGSMDLGTQEVVPSSSTFAYGIFTIDMNDGPTGHGNVSIEAQGDVNIEGSRIAAFNGGNVSVTSDGGSVNVGSGGNTYSEVDMIYVDPVTGQAPYKPYNIYGSGIVAESLPSSLLAYGQPLSYNGETPQPGNITVNAHEDITADTAGILQIALGGSTAGGPTVTLNAGRDIDLGNSGLIGGTVNATAGGNISGLIISRQNTDINAAENFNGVVLAGGTANLNASSASGTVIGITGISSSVGSSGSLTLLSQNVSAGGAQVGTTFATATASVNTTAAAASSSSEATQQATGTGESDDEKKKKKKPEIRHVGRVTVILSTAVLR